MPEKDLTAQDTDVLFATSGVKSAQPKPTPTAPEEPCPTCKEKLPTTPSLPYPAPPSPAPPTGPAHPTPYPAPPTVPTTTWGTEETLLRKQLTDAIRGTQPTPRRTPVPPPMVPTPAPSPRVPTTPPVGAPHELRWSQLGVGYVNMPAFARPMLNGGLSGFMRGIPRDLEDGPFFKKDEGEEGKAEEAPPDPLVLDGKTIRGFPKEPPPSKKKEPVEVVVHISSETLTGGISVGRRTRLLDNVTVTSIPASHKNCFTLAYGFTRNQGAVSSQSGGLTWEECNGGILVAFGAPHEPCDCKDVRIVQLIKRVEETETPWEGRPSDTSSEEWEVDADPGSGSPLGALKNVEEPKGGRFFLDLPGYTKIAGEPARDNTGRLLKSRHIKYLFQTWLICADPICVFGYIDWGVEVTQTFDEKGMTTGCSVTVNGPGNGSGEYVLSGPTEYWITSLQSFAAGTADPKRSKEALALIDAVDCDP